MELPSKDGVCTITGYFAVRSPIVKDGAWKCGSINLQDGIVLLEAFRYAINVTNAMGILPKNFTIGYKIYDSCKSTVVLKEHLVPTLFHEEKKLLGIVGPYTSSEAVLAASVFSVFHTSSISYKASSLELEDRGRYSNFFRTVPSDRSEAEAIADILLKYNWTYVSCISSHEKQRGFLVLKALIESSGKCIAKQVLLPEIAEAVSFNDAIDTISSDTKAKVIVLFTTREDTINLMEAAHKKQYGAEVLWIGGTGWGNLVLRNSMKPLGFGAISLNYYTHDHDPMFREYFCSLTPQVANYNWFKKFWEEVFGCSFDRKYNKTPCSGKEKLEISKGLPQFTTVGPVLDAVLVYAKALKITLVHLCGKDISTACFKQHYISNVLHWIRASLTKRSFTSLSRDYNISFGRNGGVNGQFSIMNLRWINGRYNYRVVGKWKASNDANTRLVITEGIHWPQGENKGVISRCSESCRTEEGQVKAPTLTVKGTICCWSCKSCKAQDIVTKNETCLACPSGYKPDHTRRLCNKLDEDHISFKHPVGITAVVFSVGGISLTTVVIGIFVHHNKRPIVKASGRELSYLMLLGIDMCFAAAIIFLCPPSKLVCGVQRFIAGLSLSLCYASLLLKTNRLYRIFRNATLSTTRPSLTSPISQVTIALSITSIQVLLGVVWSIGAPPEVYRHYPIDEDYVMLFCNTDASIMNVNLCVCLVLMLACTWFAFKTRNFPKNFNESKSTMLTMYASCFVWGVFLPIFILSNNEDNYTRTYTIVLFCDIIAYVTLAGLFGPKIRLILWPGKVTDANSSGTVSRGEIKALKRNTLMSRAIISSYPAVTMHCVNPIEEESPYDLHDGTHRSTSTTDLHL